MRDGSKSDPSPPPRAPNMSIVILRSVCVGIATLVTASILSPFIVIVVLIIRSLSTTRSGGGEVGWDLVTLAHNLPVRWLLLPFAVFAAGFAFGFRYFSRSVKQN